MNKDNLVPILKIEWSYEKYLYTNKFNLERVAERTSKISENGIKLETPNSLFKFYGKNNYNLHTLLKGYFYFSSPRYFNDPFDCLTNREEFIMRMSEGVKNHRNEIGVCCFSLINDNPLLWGHYTNNYQGFCLKFKNDNLFNNDYVSIKNHVSYLKEYEASNRNLKNAIKELEKTNLNKEDKSLISKILLIFFEYCWKSYDWNYEKEFRAISWNTTEFNRKLDYNKDLVEEIYIGHKMKENDKEYYDLLIDILRNNYPKIKVYEIKPHPLSVKLDFNEIKIND